MHYRQYIYYYTDIQRLEILVSAYKLARPNRLQIELHQPA